MKALVYEGPRQMVIRDVPVPTPKPDEVLIRVAFSGICGSELSGYEGKNALRKPPLIMGHEFSGQIEALGDEARIRYPELRVGQLVTANPLLTCGRCEYCLTGRHPLCEQRRLLSAHLPGSYAEYVAVRADALFPLPDNAHLPTYALTEPAACAVRAARLAAPEPHETGLVIGAGPIGLFIIQALADRGLKRIYCADLNPDRLKMAERSGAIPVENVDSLKNRCELVVDAVGLGATRQAAQSAVRAGGRIVWIGLHEATATLDINDMIRREIRGLGTFAYNPLEFGQALDALTEGRLWLDESWTRVEPLHNGAACFEELLRGSAVAKIWLTAN